MPLGTIDPAPRLCQELPSAQAAQLLARGAVALDVRTASEHEEDGHIPGSLLLPLAVLSSAPAVLPDDGRSILIYCSNGVRSHRAARRLAEAGIENVHILRRGLGGWTGRREHGPSPTAGPSPWLVANTSLVPPGARTLDLACGRGRHALFLATAGFMVRAIDRDASRVAQLNAQARRLRLPLDAGVTDLEDGIVDFGDGEWELILVFNFLHRPLFPSLMRALRPGGILLYETFTRGPAPNGRPSNPAFLLDPGELPDLVAPLEVIRQREGEFEGRHVASVAARRRGDRRAPAAPGNAHAFGDRH